MIDYSLVIINIFRNHGHICICICPIGWQSTHILECAGTRDYHCPHHHHQHQEQGDYILHVCIVSHHLLLRDCILLRHLRHPSLGSRVQDDRTLWHRVSGDHVHICDRQVPRSDWVCLDVWHCFLHC